MADNSVLPSSGDVIAADEILGVKYQRMKITHGSDGVNDGDTSHTNPLPVLNVAPTNAATTSVTDSITPVVLLPSNPLRKGASITNDSLSTMYLLFGTGTVSDSLWTHKMLNLDKLILNNGDFNGEISAVWSAITVGGSAKITEYEA